MKVRVTFTVDVSDDERRTIRKYYGRVGLATRNEIRDWFLNYGLDNGHQELSSIMYFEEDSDA